MDFELHGKTAIVTGGSRGIGKAIACQLAREGVDVAIVARNAQALSETAVEIARETGRRIEPIVADTTDDDSVRRMVEQVAAAFGHIDILVNSAAEPGGLNVPPTFDKVTNEAFWADMNTKVMGYLRCAREVAPYMTKQGWGRIINISGMGARMAGSTLGSMRNVAVVALNKNLADALGPRGVNVNVVHPGSTRTERLSEMVSNRARERNLTEEEVEQAIAANVSTRRFVDAREVADVVTFLASPRAIAINGAVIDASGGAGGSAIFY